MYLIATQVVLRIFLFSLVFMVKANCFLSKPLFCKQLKAVVENVTEGLENSKVVPSVSLSIRAAPGLKEQRRVCPPKRESKEIIT